MLLLAEYHPTVVRYTPYANHQSIDQAKTATTAEENKNSGAAAGI